MSGVAPNPYATSTRRRPWPMTAALAAVCVTAVMGTVVSLGQGFAVMTDCTDRYDCTSSGCAPCSTASHWVDGGWIGQGVLLFAAIVLIVLARRAVRAAAGPDVGVRVGVSAVLVVALSVGLFVVTDHEASTSYCRPGESLPPGVTSYCDD
jgi:hypothetical protein